MTNAKNNAVASIVVTEYETLRAAALGNALPPEARAGLMLFLHTEMSGWARTVSAVPAFERPTRLPTIELEAAGGTQNRNPPLCRRGNPNHCSRATS